MLISTGRPNITAAISGTGAAFIGDPADLFNGQPASACRIQWLSVSPAITDFVTLTLTFDAPIPARCAALLMPQFTTASVVPAGVKVTFSGLLSASPVTLGGNSLTSRTVLHPNGGVRRPVVFPSAMIDTLIMKTYNDLNGSTWAIANQLVDYGEIWVGKGADFGIKEDARSPLMGGLLQRKSHNNQNWALAIQAYKQPTFNINPMTEVDAIGPKSTQDDFETVMYALMTGDTSVLIPTYLKAAGNQHNNPPAVIDSTTISDQRLVRSFMIGNPDQPIELDAMGDSFFVSPIVFGESPP